MELPDANSVPSNTEHVRVSVIAPCRNEIGYIGPFLDSLTQQAQDGLDLEVLIADGLSDDGTRQVIEQHSRKYPFIRIVDNPQKIVSTGLNAAIYAATGDIIVRMDVHTEYATDYIQKCVSILQETGAANVGGPWVACGNSYLQKAIALAFQSRFSSGGAGSHSLDKVGPVDSVYLGCWKKQKLLDIGLFDEELVRNQDDELNLRLVKSGQVVWQSPQIKSCYYPRSSIKALFKQYMQYGYWKVRVIQKHKMPAAIRHIIPGGFVAVLCGLLLLTPFSVWAASCLAAVLCIYGAANLIATVGACRRIELIKYIPILPIVFGAFHFGYGYGFLRGVVDFYYRGRSNEAVFSKLTR